MEYCVQKFGGTSAADPARIAEVFTASPERNRVAVMSAVGKVKGGQGPLDQTKGTDLLKQLDKAVEQNDQRAISESQDAFIAKNEEAYRVLGNKALTAAVIDEAYNLMRPENAWQGYEWIGEYVSARLFAELTGAVYVPTGLRFDGDRLNITKSQETIAKTIIPEIQAGRQVVTEGFFGNDLETGQVRTLSRGGSDISGVIVTSALAARDPKNSWINENCTDKDGVYSADPDIVGEDKVRTIEEITYEEIREKMHGIAERNGVIHGDAIHYAYDQAVPIVVRNSFKPTAPTTSIVESRQSVPGHSPVIGISGRSMVAVDIFDMGMAEAVNYTAPILARISEEGLSTSSYPTGEDRLKLVFGSEDPDAIKLHNICEFIKEKTISSRATVEVIHDAGAVYLIGQELTRPEIYRQVIDRVNVVVGQAGLAARPAMTHEKSPSIMLSVDGREVEETIKALHQEFIEEDHAQP